MMFARTTLTLVAVAALTASAQAAPVAYWQSVSGSATINDLVGGDNNLTGGVGLSASATTVAPNPVPNPDASTTGAAGSIQFPVTNGSNRAPSTTAAPFNLNGSSSFTFEGWFLHSISDGTQSGIEVIGGDRQGDTSPATFRGWYVIMSSGNIQFYYADRNASNTANESFSINSTDRYDDGAAHHFAAVWDHGSSTMSLYVDGGFIGSDTVTGLEAYTSPGFTLGGRATTSANNDFDDSLFQGNLDELRFSNAVLAPSEFLNVPEPASLALLSLGGLLIASRRRG